jgi:hypothetical protein
MTQTANEANAILRVSLREARMVLERILQHSGMGDGMLFSVRDCAVYSAALGLSGFPAFRAQAESLRFAAAEAVKLSSEDPLTLHAGSQHAWIAAEAALDVAVDAYRRTGHGSVVVSHVREPQEMAVVSAVAEKYGLSASVVLQAEGSVEIHVRARAHVRQSLIDRIRREGIEVSRELWFELLEFSKNALAPDSVISRMHNGDIVVKPDGTVVGRRDEDLADTDLAMLLKDAPGERATPAKPKRSEASGRS